MVQILSLRSSKWVRHNQVSWSSFYIDNNPPEYLLVKFMNKTLNYNVSLLSFLYTQKCTAFQINGFKIPYFAVHLNKNHLNVQHFHSVPLMKLFCMSRSPSLFSLKQDKRNINQSQSQILQIYRKMAFRHIQKMVRPCGHY